MAYRQAAAGLSPDRAAEGCLMSDRKVALITEATGQDGAYLSEFLLSQAYTVHGVKRRSSLFNTNRVDHLYKDLHERDVHFVLHYGDLTDATNLIRIVEEVQPTEIYNLAAQKPRPDELRNARIYCKRRRSWRTQTAY
jgi:nucleoside-diphosphate-sugar epimerase